VCKNQKNKGRAEKSKVGGWRPEKSLVGGSCIKIKTWKL
jgi:hypothetical protein